MALRRLEEIARQMQDHDVTLRAVSTLVKEHIQSVRRTTNTAVANVILAICQARGSAITEETLRRRVYDVITVCTVLGYITKVDKALFWSGSDSFRKVRAADEIPVRMTRIGSKEESIRYKARLLLFYRALMVANRSAGRPATAISCPLIVIGKKGPDWIVRREQNNHRLLIEARLRPKLLSPYEVITTKTFPQAVIDAAFRTSPELGVFRELLDLDDSRA